MSLVCLFICQSILSIVILRAGLLEGGLGKHSLASLTHIRVGEGLEKRFTICKTKRKKERERAGGGGWARC